MPIIVRDIDRNAATIIMVDSNLQRENILPSEKAKAYKMKLEAIKRQAGRPGKNSAQVEQNFEGKMFTTFLLKSLNLQHSFSGGWYVFSKTSADHFRRACMKEKVKGCTHMKLQTVLQEQEVPHDLR